LEQPERAEPGAPIPGEQEEPAPARSSKGLRFFAFVAIVAMLAGIGCAIVIYFDSGKKPNENTTALEVLHPTTETEAVNTATEALNKKLEATKKSLDELEKRLAEKSQAEEKAAIAALDDNYAVWMSDGPLVKEAQAKLAPYWEKVVRRVVEEKFTSQDENTVAYGCIKIFEIAGEDAIPIIVSYFKDSRATVSKNARTWYDIKNWGELARSKYTATVAKTEVAATAVQTSAANAAIVTNTVKTRDFQKENELLEDIEDLEGGIRHDENGIYHCRQAAKTAWCKEVLHQAQNDLARHQRTLAKQKAQLELKRTELKKLRE